MEKQSFPQVYFITWAHRLLKSLQKYWIKHKDLIIFFKTVINHPRTIGAIIPSSKQLANEMASHIQPENQGIIVELGGGTGVVTEALLQSGARPEDMVVIEYSPELVNILRQRFPKIKIIEGNAEHLASLLAYETRKLNTIISSIPLRSLPTVVSKNILKEIQQVLPPGGQYIQFTYGLKRSSLSNFYNYVSKRVWMNFPPARVDVWIKHRNPA